MSTIALRRKYSSRLTDSCSSRWAICTHCPQRKHVRKGARRDVSDAVYLEEELLHSALAGLLLRHGEVRGPLQLGLAAAHGHRSEGERQAQHFGPARLQQAHLVVERQFEEACAISKHRSAE